jgi:hypothetical protein
MISKQNQNQMKMKSPMAENRQARNTWWSNCMQLIILHISLATIENQNGAYKK